MTLPSIHCVSLTFQRTDALKRRDLHFINKGEEGKEKPTTPGGNVVGFLRRWSGGY
ncbi:hypothetical protein [Planktotalea sp.]|uniref:hypothetical protein n=1 Tax=Planktotalea sp. TaxID=2029877 RepID=UPI0032971F59